MKIFNYILSIFCLGCLVILSGCDKDDDKDPIQMTAQQKATKALSTGSPWTVKTVVSKPDENTDEELLMSLEMEFQSTGADETIAPGAFEVSMDGDYIDSEGDATWAWSGTETSKITLTGATINELKNITFSPDAENPTSVTMTFELTELGGRRKGLGEYTIILE